MYKDLNSKVDLEEFNETITELETEISKKASTSVVTTGANGLMSSADKTKLNGIATNANNYSHPTSSGNKHIPSGGASGQFLKWSADGTAVWANDNNTTYTAGTGLSLSGTTFSANIGTGSSQVAAGNHTHNYLPLSGGLLTGNLKMSSSAGFFPDVDNTCYVGYDDNRFASGYFHNLDVNDTIYCTELYGNARTATKLKTARTISLSNHLSGSASFDGSANVTLSGTVRSASTSQTGIVQLNDATNSTSTTQAATSNAVKKAYDLANDKVSKSQAIPANSDLNNYTTEGFYHCAASATAGTIKNVASAIAFTLLVERHAGCKQTFTTYDNNSPKMWYRNYYNGNWGAWQRVFDSFMVKNGESMGDITASKLSSPSGSALQLQAASGNILACSRIYPNTDGDKELGVSGYRWLRVFAVNGTIQTSDRRYKTRIQNADELDCFEMIKNVDVCTYTMINKDKTKVKNEEELISLANAAEEDSTSTIQMGIMAQDLLPYECSKYILTHDITEKENGEISDIYGINPYNFSAAIMSALKTEISYRESLEEKVEELSQQIKKLQSN